MKQVKSKAVQETGKPKQIENSDPTIADIGRMFNTLGEINFRLEDGPHWAANKRRPRVARQPTAAK